MLRHEAGVTPSPPERLFGYAGRATRRELGAMALATLVILALSIGLFAMIWHVWIGDAAFSDDFTENALSRCIILLDLIPIGGCVATMSRRLHDAGRSGEWLAMLLVPVIGWGLLAVFVSLPGQRHRNAYGPDPRSPDAAWLRRVFS